MLLEVKKVVFFFLARIQNISPQKMVHDYYIQQPCHSQGWVTLRYTSPQHSAQRCRLSVVDCRRRQLTLQLHLSALDTEWKGTGLFFFSEPLQKNKHIKSLFCHPALHGRILHCFAPRHSVWSRKWSRSCPIALLCSLKGPLYFCLFVLRLCVEMCHGRCWSLGFSSPPITFLI